MCGVTWRNVIFGEEGDNEVLGVTTLEQLGVQIDPVSRQIKPLPFYLLQFGLNEDQRSGRERHGRERVIVP